MSIHIAARDGEIADRILLPGDPLRAKYIAENFWMTPSAIPGSAISSAIPEPIKASACPFKGRVWGFLPFLFTRRN